MRTVHPAARHTTLFWWLFGLSLACLAGLTGAVAHASAGDIREAAIKAREDRQAALREKRDSEARILADRDSLTAAVAAREAEAARLEREIAATETRSAALEQERQRLAEDWSRRELDFREISGVARVAARDLESMLRASLLTAAAPERLDEIAPLLEEGYFPDIDDLALMARLFLDEAARAGEVTLRHDVPLVDRAGETVRGDVLTLGKFTAAYRLGGEVGFLRYAPEDRSLFAIPALPPHGLRRELARYMAGRDESAPVDLSGGGALRQFSQRQSLREHLASGGPIVWPILAIGVVALGLVIERAVWLNRVRGDTDRIMGRVNELAARGDWRGCDGFLEQIRTKPWPVVRVISAGMTARGEDREALESVLQEAILRELPHLERFLSVLAVFAAVAPLLGLLGTVTGMIETFRVITVYGTGDPKLMSGGISEALVTTELGLAVAIPIMLLHTVLSRRVDHIVGDMEEKAIALVNIIQKERRRDGSGRTDS
jgi:biopolymer transport protein ExbB